MGVRPPLPSLPAKTLPPQAVPSRHQPNAVANVATASPSNFKRPNLIHLIAHMTLRMIHAENELPRTNALRGIAYTLTDYSLESREAIATSVATLRFCIAQQRMKD